MSASPASAHLTCSTLLNKSEIKLISQTSDLAKKTIIRSSTNLSRTLSNGRKFLAPEDLSRQQVQKIALKNFNLAVDFIIDNSKQLEISLSTAIQINTILTQGLVPEEIVVSYYHRLNSEDSSKVDSFLDPKSPQSLYDWLLSSEALGMDPPQLAEIIHHNIAAYDSFPDGNGRLSRLMADLVLIKAGYKPVLYNNRKEYFEVGNARADSSREQKKDYFFRMFSAGQLLN